MGFEDRHESEGFCADYNLHRVDLAVVGGAHFVAFCACGGAHTACCTRESYFSKWYY
jgi:hypothetical protein